jgi:Tfp pilus assembly protein PilO
MTGNPGEIWRQRLWVWLPALLFFLANAVAFSVYRLGYAGDVADLEDELDRQERQIGQLREQRTELETLVARVRTNDLQVRQLYSEYLATRRQAVTQVTTEFRRLARQAGLLPGSVSFDEEEIESYGLVRRSFSYTVEGTYAELRKFINLLELSPSFLTIEEISVAGGADEGPELKIDLTLSTLFARDPDAAAAPQPAPVAAADRRPS